MGTDIESDIAFMNQQKELRSLYRGFRETIHAIRQGSQENAAEASDDDSDGIRSDAKRLLSEITHMQKETDEIMRLVGRPKFAKYARVQRIKRQLLNFQKINASLRTRAEALVAVD